MKVATQPCEIDDIHLSDSPSAAFPHLSDLLGFPMNDPPFRFLWLQSASATSDDVGDASTQCQGTRRPPQLRVHNARQRGPHGSRCRIRAYSYGSRPLIWTRASLHRPTAVDVADSNAEDTHQTAGRLCRPCRSVGPSACNAASSSREATLC